ncbi:MAG: hypothetical protein AAGI07_13100, partial [Bacteroidota bacterium]
MSIKTKNNIEYPLVSRIFTYHKVACSISFSYSNKQFIKGVIAIPFDAPISKFTFTAKISFNKFKKKVLEFSDEEIQQYVDKIITKNQ